VPHQYYEVGTLAIDGWAVTFGTARRGMGGATRGCGGDNVAPTFVTSGVQGGGPVKMIFPSTADSLYTVLYK